MPPVHLSIFRRFSAPANTDHETDAETDSASTGTGATETGEASGDTESVATTGAEGSTGSDSGESSGGVPMSDDPFDPRSCAGVPWTAADAANELGVATRSVLANSMVQVRSRTCPGGACTPWGAEEDWTISYLTYSGGVTTRYKDIPADMNLVLFADPDAAAPNLSMQHVTFGAGGYPDEDGIVYGFPPSAVQYPHLRAYNVMPDSGSDYIDLDDQVSNGTLVLGQDCARWTATPFGRDSRTCRSLGSCFDGDRRAPGRRWTIEAMIAAHSSCSTSVEVNRSCTGTEAERVKTSSVPGSTASTQASLTTCWSCQRPRRK